MLRKILIIIFLLSFPVSLIANNLAPMQINPYYNANCASYSGTWQGFFTDPTDLFGSGGPWPVQMSLSIHAGTITGTVTDHNAPSYVAHAMQGQLSAQCTQGSLSNILLKSKNMNGSVSQAGLLVSKNVLLLKINYQNAMIGTTFLVVLQRVSN